MNKSIILLVHIGFWLCFFFLIAIILGIVFGSQQNVADDRVERALITIIFFVLIPSVISFYANYFFVFPRINKQKNYFYTVLLELAIPLFAGVVGYLSVNQIYGDVCLSGNELQESEPLEMTLFIAFIAFITGVVALVIRGFITWSQELKLKDSLKQKNHEMEM